MYESNVIEKMHNNSTQAGFLNVFIILGPVSGNLANFETKLCCKLTVATHAHKNCYTNRIVLQKLNPSLFIKSTCFYLELVPGIKPFCVCVFVCLSVYVFFVVVRFNS